MLIKIFCKAAPQPEFPWPAEPLVPLSVAANNFDAGTPPAIVHNRPVPAQAMQLKKLRRSTPSLAAGLSRFAVAVSVD